jgi:hypothetical protein
LLKINGFSYNNALNPSDNADAYPRGLAVSVSKYIVLRCFTRALLLDYIK